MCVIVSGFTVSVYMTGGEGLDEGQRSETRGTDRETMFRRTLNTIYCPALLLV